MGYKIYSDEIYEKIEKDMERQDKPSLPPIHAYTPYPVQEYKPITLPIIISEKDHPTSNNNDHEIIYYKEI